MDRLLGATLATRAPEIYRALIESSAFGTRLIIEAFESNGLPIEGLILTGGIPQKNRLLVEIYANATGREIRLGGSSQAAALGAAMYAAVAAGVYSDIRVAAEAMGKLTNEVVQPTPGHQRVYDRLYAEYKRLYEYFSGKKRAESSNLMARLKDPSRTVNLELLPVEKISEVQSQAPH